MRYFSKNDWDCFAGAESAKDGRLPMINENENPLSICLIVSEGSTQLIMDMGECGDTACWDLEVPYDLGVLVSASIESKLTGINNVDELEAITKPLGFIKIM